MSVGDLRGHQPIRIEEFNGLFSRGDHESCPLDHVSETDNCMSFYGGVTVRPGLEIFVAGDENETFPNVIRMYKYVYRNTGDGLLVLDDAGNIYHTLSPTPFVPILSIPTMTDFAYVSMGGRAYISPHNGVTGLEDEFLYVYKGDGTPARKAAGAGPITGLTAVQGAATGTAAVEAGYHVLGVAYETDTGFITKISPLIAYQAVTDGFEINLTGIPVSPDSFVTKRHIVASKLVDPLDWDDNLEGYELFFVPNGTIENNTATALNISFFDAELLESASYLLDLFEEIPAFVNLTSFHNRLVGVGEFGDPIDEEEFGLISTARLSAPGQPEAIDEVSGLIVVPLNGQALTNCQEYRDVLYLFKETQTHAYTDNGDDPSAWPGVIIDQGVGTSVHGIGYVLDSGGVNIEYLMIIDFSGILLFDGAYRRPELTWKIKRFWFEQDRTLFKKMQFMNDSITQFLYLNLPDGRILLGDYSVALDSEKIKWWPWSFKVDVTTISLINKNQLVIGAIQEVTP